MQKSSCMWLVWGAVFTLFSTSPKEVKGSLEQLCYGRWQPRARQCTLGKQALSEVGITSPHSLREQGELPLPKSLIKCAFVRSLQSFHWVWFVCPEFVMEFEGRRGQWTFFWVETVLVFGKLEAFVSWDLWENSEEVGEASVLCPSFPHRLDHLFQLSRQCLLM